MAKKNTKKVDVYKMVSDKFITMLDNGVIPWARPWAGANHFSVSRSTGSAYSLLNQILLQDDPASVSSIDDLIGGEFATFKQIKDEGGKVNKGAESKQIVFWKMWKVEKTDEDGNKVLDEDGNPEKKTVPVLKYFNVFNIAEDTDLEPKYMKAEEMPENPAEPDEMAEEILTAYWNAAGIKVNRDEKSNRAFYNRADDSITVPAREQFSSTAEYYSVLFHETAHATGAPNRLNRVKGQTFGDEAYSKEELTAEITAAALVAVCGLETESSIKNSAAYIQNWRNAIAEDNALVVGAASRADKAFEEIMKTYSAA